MIARPKSLFLFCSALLGASYFSRCGSGTKPQAQEMFYGEIIDWDIKYVPLIPPFRAASTERSGGWAIGGWIKQGSNRRGALPVREFGVSKNYIYGTTSDPSTWFLLNTNDTLFAQYDSQEALINTMSHYGLDFRPMATGDAYFERLTKAERLYWFPERGEAYPRFENIRPDSCIEVIVTGNGKALAFQVRGALTKLKSRIHYVRMHYDNKDNDLYYLSIDHSSPVLIQDGTIVPAFVEGEAVEVAVYTPYPVGQAKGIEEEDRIVLSKTIQLKD